MTDIASLGLAVDSGPVAKANTELDKFAQAAKGADQAAQGFARGTQQAATATQQMAANVSKSVNSVQALNARLGVRDGFGGADRAADIEAYGKAMDDLRAKFNPLFAIERQHAKTIEEINHAARVGAITEGERAAAVTRAQAAYTLQTRALNGAGQAIELAGRRGGLAAHQLSNLSFQLNDVVTLAAMGADPLRIFASQAGQIVQILQQSEGGLAGGFRSLLQTITSMITPFRLVVAGAVALGATLTAAAFSWANAQSNIRIGLLGTGAAAGITVNQINAIADAAARAGQATVGEARDMALALNATGRASAEVVTQAIAAGRGLSKLFGEDLTDTTARLAKAIADPAKGMEDFNRRLSAFDAATIAHARSLQAQGRHYEANQLLLGGVERATEDAAQATSGWENAWNKLRDTMSRWWSEVGNPMAVVGLGTIEQRMESLRDTIKAMENTNWHRMYTAAIEAETEKLRALENQLERTTEAQVRRTMDARRVRDSNELQNMVLGLAGEEAAYSRLIDQRERLNKLASDPIVVNSMSEAARKELETAKTVVELRLHYFRTSKEAAQEDYAIQLQAMNARTAAQKGELAHREAMARLAPQGDPNALLKAGQAQSLAILQHNKEILETQKQQLLTANQRNEQAQLELSLIGRTSDEQEKARAQLQVKQQLQAEALRLYADENAIVQSHLAALQRRAAIESQINQAIRERNLMQDLQFQRDQIGRSSGEQDVYARLRAAGLLTDGEIETAFAQRMAAEIRLNSMLQKNQEASREFAQGFVRDLMAGKSAVEALANALNRLADKLLDIGMDYAFQAIFGGKGGGNSLLAGLFGSKSGGSGWDATVVPSFHDGGIVGHGGKPRAVSASVFSGAKRYHKGGLAGLNASEVPAILQRGEIVLPKGWGGGGGVMAPVTFSIDARGATPDAVAALNAKMESIVASLPQQIVATIRQSRDRGIA